MTLSSPQTFRTLSGLLTFSLVMAAPGDKLARNSPCSRFAVRPALRGSTQALVPLITAASERAQTPGSGRSAAGPSATPAAQPSPSASPPASSTIQSPAASAPSPVPSTQSTAPSSTQTNPAATQPGQMGPAAGSNASTGTSAGQITLEDTLRLAMGQVSAFQQAGLNLKIAEEDVRQARAALLPRITSPSAYTYNTPLLRPPPGTPRAQSFINLNAISEYQSFLSIGGDVDTAGRLHATLRRNLALLDAARAGTEVARRALISGVSQAYLNLSLASAKRRAAEQNLAAAQDFERITGELLSGGEVAPVDLTRAQLQTMTRRDELERARSDEVVAAGGLRVFAGYDLTRPIGASDLAMAMPDEAEIQRLTADRINKRPEFAQFEAVRRAAAEEVRIARSERRPQLTYIFNGGIDTDTIDQPRLHEHIGASAAFNLTIPIFDFGASKSRERQARLRAQVAESQRAQEIRAFNQEFYAARTEALSAAARVRLAGNGVAFAESNVSASIARYRGGEATILEVTDAQTTLAAQRLALYQALFDYQSARVRLIQAVGP